MPRRLNPASGRRLLILVPFLWLTVLFLIPFLIVFRISLSDIALAQPPYLPVLDWSEGVGALFSWLRALDFENYAWILEDDLYWISYLSSLRIAALSTAAGLLVAFPLAYGMARAPKRFRTVLVMLLILPFWTSFLIRVYAWIGILKKEGLLNFLLIGIGIIDRPLIIHNTEIAVYIGIVYSYLPFMALPIYASLERLDADLLEAAADLGATPLRAFWQVTLPLARPGILAGCFLMFIPAVGEFVIPDLLGGSDTLMIGRTLWNEFFANRDWPVASAVAVLLLLLLVVPMVLLQRLQRQSGPF